VRLELVLPPLIIPLGRHWHHSCDKTYQAFPLCLHTLQVNKNWTMGSLGMRVTHTAVHILVPLES